ncbi:MAG: type II toxin-antitoxin system mRNA interferase toxin, RelE/StbE family [candidate division Zixibacteria bacterium]|nr:type II toxin-antitoxin system mRNA interferase toxin, RelE/StbE family [Candidatus Tariuqbacter arcticus]
MRELITTAKFNRAFRKFTRHNPKLQHQIEETLRAMCIDVFAPHLGTHKLSGNLVGLRACYCGYDCRIVFSIEEDASTNQEVIILINIGTHDRIY